MKTTIIQDRWNNRKEWIIKHYSTGHYYVNQKVGGKILNKKFTRMTKKQITAIFEHCA